MEAFTERIKELLGTLKLLFGFIVNDIRTKPRTFKIGVFSVFIVVAFLVLLQSLLELTPILFLRLAQDQNGQFDLVLAPVSADNDTRVTTINSSVPIIRVVNLTDLEEKLQDQPVVQAMAPRWELPANVSTLENPTQDYRTIALVLDSSREKEDGFGANLDTINLGPGECWITSSLASLLQLSVGQSILLKANLLMTLAQDGAMTVDGSSQEDTIAAWLAQQLVANYTMNDSLTALGINDTTSSSGQQALNEKINGVRSSLQNSTRSDGFIDPVSFNEALMAAGVISQPIPAQTLAGVPAADVENLLNTIQANNNDNFTTLGKTFMVEYLTPLIMKTLNISQSFEVIQTIENPEGKWSSELGNVIVIDSKYVQYMFMDRFYQVLHETPINTGNLVVDNLLTGVINSTEFNKSIEHSFENFDINEYALSVNVLLINREKIYKSQDDIRPNLIKATDQIFTDLGLDYSVVVTAPLSDALTNFFLFKNFLDNTFIAVVFILTILAILLIYSLMNTNVDEKKYEFAMLRVLGIKRYDLIGLMVIQSLFFAIPGLILGFALAYALNTVFSYVIFNYTLLKTSYTFPVSAIALGVSVGIVIPLVSNIIPIRKALSNTLRDSLNAYSRSVGDISIHVAKLANLGISPAMAVGALTLIVLGFLGFYVAPYGYVFANMPLFFLILNIILLAMIVGITLLANLIRSPFQKVMLYLLLLFFCKDKPLRTVIKKNSIAHNKRNSNTSLMFTLSLAFLIFAGVGFKVNANLITQQLQSTLGSDIVVTSLSYETTFLNEAAIRASIENFKILNPSVVRDYAFVSQPFSLQPSVTDPLFMPLTQYPTVNLDIVSVDETYLRSVYEDFYISTSLDPAVSVSSVPNSKYGDGVAALYDETGIQSDYTYNEDNILSQRDFSSYNLDSFIGTREVRFLISENIGKQTSLKAGKTGIIVIQSVYFQSRIRNVAKKLPGFAFTAYESTSETTIITSHEDYRYIRDLVWARLANTSNLAPTIAYNATIPANSTYNIPKSGLVVRVHSGTSSEDRTALFNLIQTEINGKFTFVTDVTGMVDTFNNALFFTDVFFVLVSVIAIILTFFFTLVAFVGNVSENLWEFGVLRAVGLTRSQMTRTYVYEALSLIISAIILGTAAGIVLAVVITVQFNLFTELPFKLIFPVTVFVITVVASLLIAVIGPRAAVRQVKNKQIASIIKALD